MTTTDSTARKYAINDFVQTPRYPYASTVIGLVDQTDPGYLAIDAPGPHYLVNEGNVFSEVYEVVYAESQLQPYELLDDMTEGAAGTGPAAA